MTDKPDFASMDLKGHLAAYTKMAEKIGGLPKRSGLFKDTKMGIARCEELWTKLQDKGDVADELARDAAADSQADAAEELKDKPTKPAKVVKKRVAKAPKAPKAPKAEKKTKRKQVKATTADAPIEPKVRPVAREVVKRRSRREGFTYIITADENPFRQGGVGHELFKIAKRGKTVANYLDKGKEVSRDASQWLFHMHRDKILDLFDGTGKKVKRPAALIKPEPTPRKGKKKAA